MKLIVACSFLFLAVTAVPSKPHTGGKVIRQGFQVLRIRATSESQLDILQKLYLDDENVFQLDFWKEPKGLGRPVDIMVSPNHIQSFEAWLTENNIPSSVWIQDVQKLIDEESQAMESKKTVPFQPLGDVKAFDFTNYHSFDDITAFIQSVATTYPDIAQLFTMGKSVEGRTMYGLKIGKGANKHGFWVDAGIHAREWIAPAVAVWVINELTANYVTNQKYVDQLDWYIVPSVNPDGYEYSRSSSGDRLWRKNRSKGRICDGVDLNRNFPFHWGETGISTNQCSEIYCGKAPLSEPEAAAMATTITSLKDQLKAMITLHSYSEDYLVPYGYVVPAVTPADFPELLDAAQKASDAGAKITGVKYAAVNSAAGLYAASGASDDWSKNLGIKYVYTIETRPDGDASNGFVLPPNQIVPSAQEIWAGFKVIADRVIALP